MATSRLMHLSHNDGHVPAVGGSWGKDAETELLLVIYLSRSFSIGPSSMQSSLDSFPIIHMRWSSICYVSAAALPSLSQLQWTPVKHAVSQSCNGDANLRRQTGGMTNGAGAAAGSGIVSCVAACRLSAWGCGERWRIISVPLNQERCVFELPLLSSHLCACVCVHPLLPPPLPLSLQNKGLSPVTLCAGELQTPPSLILPCLCPSPPSLFLPAAYSNSWRGHMV